MTFNVTAAVNKIAEIEAAIATPTPGISNSYTFGNSPADISAAADLPAVVHIERGPLTAFGVGGTVDRNYYYQIDSLALLIEALPDGYPDDSSDVAPLWLSIAQAFAKETNRLALAHASNAVAYDCIFNPNSYQLRRWPPEPLNDYRVYWSLLYTHRFLVQL